MAACQATISAWAEVTRAVHWIKSTGGRCLEIRRLVMVKEYIYIYIGELTLLVYLGVFFVRCPSHNVASEGHFMSSILLTSHCSVWCIIFHCDCLVKSDTHEQLGWRADGNRNGTKDGPSKSLLCSICPLRTVHGMHS